MAKSIKARINPELLRMAIRHSNFDKALDDRQSISLTCDFPVLEEMFSPNFGNSESADRRRAIARTDRALYLSPEATKISSF